MATNSSRIISYAIQVGDQFSKTFDKLDQKVQNLSGNFLGKTAKSLERISDGFTRSGRRLTFAITAPLTLLGAAAFKASADMEDLEIQFNRILKSSSKGQLLLSDFKDVAKELPFSFQELSAASVDILRARDSGPEKMLLTLKRLGDVAVATKTPIEELGMMYRNLHAYGAIDMRSLQFLEKANLPLVQSLQDFLFSDKSSKLKGIKLSPEAIKKLIQQNRIPSSVFDKILEQWTTKGGMFENAAAQRAETPMGAWERLQQSRQRALTTLGNVGFNNKSVVEGLKELSEWVDKIAKKFEVWAEKNPELVKNLVKLAGVLALIGPALMTIGSTVYALSQVTLALKAMLIVMRAMTLTPLGLALTAIALAIWGIVKAVEAFKAGKLKEATDNYAKSFDPHLPLGARIAARRQWSTEDKVAMIQGYTNSKERDKYNMDTALAGRSAIMRMQGNVSINLNDPGNYVESVKTSSPTFTNMALGTNLGW